MCCGGPGQGGTASATPDHGNARRPESVVVTLLQPVRRGDLPALCAGVEALLAAGTAAVVVCDVDATHVDLATVDALARLQVVASRLGRELRLRRAPPDLTLLVQLAGLAGVIRRSDLAVEPGREAEHREEARGVEEERDAGDLPS